MAFHLHKLTSSYLVVQILLPGSLNFLLQSYLQRFEPVILSLSYLWIFEHAIPSV